MNEQVTETQPETTQAPAGDELATGLRDIIDLVAAGVAGSGEQVYRELVRRIAQVLKVDHAFIGELCKDSPERARIIAGSFDGTFQEGVEYALAGTPCEHVMGQEFRFFPERVTEMFPDPHAKELGAVGYAGIPLFGSAGQTLGLMAVVSRSPLRDRQLTEDLMRIFSVRAAVELERGYANQARGEKERELSDSEDRLRATVESALDCIIAMDDAGRVLGFNPAAEQCFGYRKQDILGRNLAELVIPERFREGHQRGMDQFHLSRQGKFLGKRVDVTAMRADGSEFPAELAIDVARSAGRDIFIAYLRDITERRNAEEERTRLEAQLRQAQKMEAIGHLTGGIAHDFNNILTSMLGYVDMAAERVKGLGDDKLSKYLGRARQSGQRAHDLIKQMLTFSRGERGEPRQVALAPLIKEWIKLVKSTLPSSVEIRTEFDPAVRDAMLDPVQVEQVLMNLCINARDAMRGHGRITISLRPRLCTRCECASCRQPVEGEFIELAVRDTGEGVSDAVRERMFEPFFSTKGVGRGSGMGLAMVHGIVHEYGGHLVVDSRPGEGATIRVMIRPMDGAAEAANSEVQPAREVLHQGLQGRVLVVDDEPSVGEFMQDLLEDWGLTVTTYNASVEAAQQFANDPDAYDLVILDQTMPRMTGLELAGHLLKLRPDLPVLLYTGYSAEISEQIARDAGIRALVRKPVDPAALRELIEGLLSSR